MDMQKQMSGDSEMIDSTKSNANPVMGEMIQGKKMFDNEEDRKNDELAAVKMLAFNAKNSKFRDKRTEMLDNVKR